MLKKFLTFGTLLWTIFAGAYDLPGFREVNGVQVWLLPEKPGAPVEFTFEKQDLNGYSGSDAVVFSLLSPANQVVWEEACPDDGTEIGNWKTGPRQLVKCTFQATEKGIYCMKVNTPSSVDMMLLFDRATVKNASWAVVGNRFRFADVGGRKIDAFLLLSPNKLGEKREQTMQLTTTPRSSVKNMTLLAGEEVLIPPTTLEVQPKTEALRYHKFPVNRMPGEDIYEIRAEAFWDIAPFQFPQYGELVLCAEKKFAENFRKELQSIDKDNYLELKSPAKYEGMAFARNTGYQLEFVPEKPEQFEFKVDLLGKTCRFRQDSSKVAVTIPAQNAYADMDLSGAPAGKLIVTRLTRGTSQAIMPVSGKVVDGKEELVWTAQANAKEYTVRLCNLDTGKILSVKSDANRLALNAAGETLTPGVWQWEVAARNGKFSTPAFFLIPQKADTGLLYFHDFAPQRDSVAGASVTRISVKVDGKKSSELDLAHSQILVNGTTFPLEALAADTVGLSKLPALRDGHNQVCVKIVDNAGNFSTAEWGFFGTQAEARQLAHDERGNIFFNGVPFFPVIYYGYNTKQPLERLGFNTILTNTLTAGPTLDVFLARNLKVLDCGSVYHGYYSKGSTPEADVQNYAASPAVRHHARLAAWMDEMDVHRPLAKIKEFLALYGSSENGWRGVCSCNRAFYPAMADCGDYLMVDFYAHGKSLFAQDDCLKLARQAAGKKPLMILVMGFSYIDPALTGFIPTPKEAEYSAFSALRLNVNALGLYQCGSYRMESYSGAWQAATKLYKNVSALSFVTYGKDVPEQISVTAKAGKIAFRAVQCGKRVYIIAQNSSFEPAVATFSVKFNAMTPAKVLFENRLVNIADGKFIDGFQAADTHVYMLEMPENQGN